MCASVRMTVWLWVCAHVVVSVRAHLLALTERPLKRSVLIVFVDKVLTPMWPEHRALTRVRARMCIDHALRVSPQ